MTVAQRHLTKRILHYFRFLLPHIPLAMKRLRLRLLHIKKHLLVPTSLYLLPRKYASNSTLSAAPFSPGYCNVEETGECLFSFFYLTPTMYLITVANFTFHVVDEIGHISESRTIECSIIADNPPVAVLVY